VFPELGKRFNLSKALSFGGIPSIYSSGEPWEDLKSYVGEYLKEEIIAEAATRNVPAFSRFLEVAAIMNGQIINYEKIGSDAQVTRSTVQNYYQILRDTLIGRDLPSFRKTPSRKAIHVHKFFFFDLGVVNYLKRMKVIQENSVDYGMALEAYIHHELSSYCDYYSDNDLTYWRSQSGYEVDFLLNEEIGIEIKSTKNVNQADLKGLMALAEDVKLRKKIVVCREGRPRKIGAVDILPVEEFLERLWSRSL
jgi:predicted AAA+ superfamily ATPase